MIECNVLVAEEIFMLRKACLIAAFAYIHPWQTCLRVRLPPINHVPHVLRLRYFPQVLDVVVEAVAVDVVHVSLSLLL